MIRLSVVHAPAGPLEDYGLEENLGTPNIEDEFRYTGPKANELFDNYGGTSTGTDDDIPAEKKYRKYIVLDCKNIKKQFEMPELKGFKILSLNRVIKNAKCIFVNPNKKDAILSYIRPMIYIFDVQSTPSRFALINLRMEEK